MLTLINRIVGFGSLAKEDKEEILDKLGKGEKR